MRRIYRGPLLDAEQGYLDERTIAVRDAVNPGEFSKKAWSNKSKSHFKVIRQNLEDMCSGRAACMYCDDSVGTDIDHFEPRTRAPLRTFDWSNYLLACSHCNSNAKRSDFPVDDDGNPLLLNPTQEDPNDFIWLYPVTGRYLTESEKGLKSIEVYQLNRNVLKDRRIDAWRVVVALIEKYVRLLDDGRNEAARLTLETLHLHAFGEILEFIRSSAHAQSELIGSELEDAILAHPEI